MTLLRAASGGLLGVNDMATATGLSAAAVRRALHSSSADRRDRRLVWLGFFAVENINQGLHTALASPADYPCPAHARNAIFVLT